MIVDYEVVVGSDANDLGLSVMSFVGEGYEPIGGVFVAEDGVCYQAMIKREEASL